MLSKLLQFAERECGINLPRGNPVSKIRKPTDGKARDRRLTQDEFEKLERECRKSRNAYLWPAVQLSLEMTLRQGELLALRWKDIDFKRNIAMLHETKNGESRAVPLSPHALAVLNALPRSIGGLVIPLQRMTLFHVFKAAVVRAGIQDFTWHDLRHEAISRLAEMGNFNVLEIAAVSGHKTLSMLKRYTHIQAENLAKKLAQRS